MKLRIFLFHTFLFWAVPCFSQRDTVLSVLYFDVNESQFEQKELLKITNIIDSCEVDNIKVIGHTSPEGGTAINVRLSKERGKRVADSLAAYTDISIKLENEPYTWSNLADSIRDTDVVTIIKAGGAIEKNLRASQYWRVIRNTWLPKFRTTEVYLYIIPKPIVIPQEEILDTNEIVVEPVVEQDSVISEQDSTQNVNPILIRVPLLNVGTNVLGDFAYVPKIGFAPLVNVNAEAYFKKVSLEAEWMFPWWAWEDRHDYLQILNLTLKPKYYFQSDDFTKHYIGIYTNSGLYDISFDGNKGWQGEAWGVGGVFGYASYIGGTPWRYDVFIEIGYMRSVYDDYSAGTPFRGKYYYNWTGAKEDFMPRSNVLNYFGPTNLGVSLKRDILYRFKHE